MCYHTKQAKTARELEQRFAATFAQASDYVPHDQVSGFAHPLTPVIASKAPQRISLLSWGLIPPWAKDNSIRQYTLNARLETMREKPSFRDSVQRPCLVLADGFYEWQWLDPKGKRKQKYVLTLPGGAAFAFAGLWSDWVDRATGHVQSTYTILTTEADALMAQIHNSKKRMPLILAPENEAVWLAGQPLGANEVTLLAQQV